ncbi:hypothetical protein RJ640_008780 [Escallonia rubra]|uniref:Uncharacterized protein n=1 Tax=Escallonia rubra TaxID=112253 RepID=A0AA88R706_9ASTE|nr:hypothetical protein RJ640_008780 [Escallonia rubra]
MGGNNRQKKSSGFSLFNIFKSRKPRRGEDTRDDFVNAYKVFPSDEDGRRWAVAEPGIDRKASAYIDSIQKEWNLEDNQFITPAVAIHSLPTCDEIAPVHSGLCMENIQRTLLYKPFTEKVNSEKICITPASAWPSADHMLVVPRETVSECPKLRER